MLHGNDRVVVVAAGIAALRKLIAHIAEDEKELVVLTTKLLAIHLIPLRGILLKHPRGNVELGNATIVAHFKATGVYRIIDGHTAILGM